MNRNPKQFRQNKAGFNKWLLVIPIAIVLIGVFGFIIYQDQDDSFDNIEYVNGHLLNRKLLSIAENQWVKIYPQPTSFWDGLLSENSTGSELSWHRQGHAGMGFDSKAKSLLIFGSNTHGEDWDNRVHEFNLLNLEWIEHYPASDKNTYRADAHKYAIAGENDLFPWAMHTYDNVDYIPEMDALLVSSVINHTPYPTGPSKQAEFNPTWIYSLNTRKWRILDQEDVPTFFASGSTYDPLTSSLWAYKKRHLWQFDILKQKWKEIPGEHKNDLLIHFVMTTDTKRHQLVFFGNSKKSNIIWVYTPGLWPGEPGKWENKHPRGDACPKDQHFPVAFDKQQGVFLLVPDENKEKSITLVYSPDANKYIRIKGADMPANGMNYMMEYDPYHRLFFLVTGDKYSPVNVWAFRLNMQTLNNTQT